MSRFTTDVDSERFDFDKEADRLFDEEEISGHLNGSGIPFDLLSPWAQQYIELRMEQKKKRAEGRAEGYDKLVSANKKPRRSRAERDAQKSERKLSAPSAGAVKLFK